MENPDLLNNELPVSPAVQRYFTEMAKWGRFLAVTGFIFCVFLAIFSFFIPSIIMEIPPNDTLSPGLSSWTSTGITALYLVLAIILFFPCLYLYKFSEKIRVCVETSSQENFDAAIKSLKTVFRFLGFLTIIMLSVYAIVFVVTMIRLALASDF